MPDLFYSILANKKDMKYRSRTEIVSMILEIASQGTSKTKIMYKAYLSYSQLNRYLSFLIEDKLIEYKPGLELYTLTEKGERLLHMYKDLDNMILLKNGQTKFFHS